MMYLWKKHKAKKNWTEMGMNDQEIINKLLNIVLQTMHRHPNNVHFNPHLYESVVVTIVNHFLGRNIFDMVTWEGDTVCLTFKHSILTSFTINGGENLLEKPISNLLIERIVQEDMYECLWNQVNKETFQKRCEKRERVIKFVKDHEVKV